MFLHNLFEEFCEKCLECNKEFLNLDKYKFIEWYNQDIVIKNQLCNVCS